MITVPFSKYQASMVDCGVICLTISTTSCIQVWINAFAMLKKQIKKHCLEFGQGFTIPPFEFISTYLSKWRP